MASWYLTVAVGFIFFCIQGLPTHGKAATKRTASEIPPGEDGFIVKLETFSGRPDPQWIIRQNNPNYSAIKSIFDNDSAKKYKQINAPSKLGYQGFVVQEVKKGKKQNKQLIVGQETPETKELQLLLLRTIPDGTQISTEVKTNAEKEIRSGKVSANVTTTTKRFAPWYRPDDWNDEAYVTENNCYNYASTIRTNTFGQPGTGSGKPFPDDFTAEDVKRAAEADGCTFKTAKKHMCAPTGVEHLAALFIYIGKSGKWWDKDYHWYRLDNNGYWSHKPGQTPATDRDADGDRIRDPREAAQDSDLPYTFVCFMTINRKTIKVR